MEITKALRQRLKRMEYRHRRRAREMGCDWEKVDFLSVCERDQWECDICGQKIDPYATDRKNMLSYEHRVALSGGGGHTADNSAPAHLSCNLSKARETDTPNARKIKRIRGETGQKKRQKKRPSRLSSKHPSYRKPKMLKRQFQTRKT